MECLIDPQVWAGLLTLTALEVVLGIDNLVFIAVLVARVRPEHQALARKLGLSLALGTRLVLLAAISWITHLTVAVFAIAGHGFSWRDLILIAAGCSWCSRVPRKSTSGWKATPTRRTVLRRMPDCWASCCRSPCWISSSHSTA